MKGAGFTVWCTGLSGAGKTTICGQVERELKRRGVPVAALDGDVVRKGLSRGLGFSPEDRIEQSRRVAAVAELLNAHGIVVLVSLISPYREAREAARSSVPSFLEVYVRCSLEECARRDPKGLYDKAMKGEIPAFTGVSDPYEAPESPDLEVDTEQTTPEQAAHLVVADLERRGLVPPDGRRRVVVELTEEGFAQVERAASGAGMDGVGPFLEMVAREAAQSLDVPQEDAAPAEDEDDETVLKRLRDLGYID